MPGLTDHYLNITTANMRQYALEQYERDTIYGPSTLELGLRRTAEIRRHCMSAEVMTTADDAEMQKVREYAECYAALAKDAVAVQKFLDRRAGEHVFVRINGKLHTIQKNYGASYELPVTVRPAMVIGE